MKLMVNTETGFFNNDNNAIYLSLKIGDEFQ